MHLMRSGCFGALVAAGLLAVSGGAHAQLVPGQPIFTPPVYRQPIPKTQVSVQPSVTNTNPRTPVIIKTVDPAVYLGGNLGKTYSQISQMRTMTSGLSSLGGSLGGSIGSIGSIGGQIGQLGGQIGQLGGQIGQLGNVGGQIGQLGGGGKFGIGGGGGGGQFGQLGGGQFGSRYGI